MRSWDDDDKCFYFEELQTLEWLTECLNTSVTTRIPTDGIKLIGALVVCVRQTVKVLLP